MASDGFGSYDRIPPQNLEAEQAVLGSMLIERPAIEKAGEILKPEDFYRDAHRFLFEAMMALAERDEPVDLITLKEELDSRSLLETVGGEFYLLNLMEAPSTAANIEYYARLVEEKAILRRLMDAGTQIQGLAYSEFDAIDEVVDRAEKIVFDVGQRRMGQFFYHLRPLLNEELDRIEKRYENKGITTGRMTPFDDLNYMTAGFQPSDLIIVAARPSMGKTALTVQMCQFVALQEKLPVAIFSLEMSKEQLVARMIGTEARVNMHDLRTGYLKSEDWKKVGEGISRLSEAPIYIDDTPDVSAMEMRAKCRRLQAEHGLGMIMIDYLQLMRSHKRTENRNQELSEIARACKGLARELKIPVIALSQLSRAVESRPDKRPMLSDLRECVIGDTLLTDASTGRQVPIRDIKAGDCILGVDPSQKIGTYAVKDVWSTGVKPVFTLTTRTGRSVTASANHPFLTANGWKRLDELIVNDVIATAMQQPKAARLPDEDLAMWTACDLLWEPIVSIEPAGEQETFDIKVECANFLANGIVAHNSGAIEAEADVVMFIYREAYYKMKETVKNDDDPTEPEQGQGDFKIEEAELIIAKQRNGPTGRVMVGFRPQFARFENLDRTHREDRDE